MAEDGGLTREQVKQVSEYIDRGLRTTCNRMQALGMGEDSLLDPDEAIDRQVAKLRALYLEAEKTALPFDSSQDHFWRMLQVRLQPVVLAYSTHEKFIQSLGQQGLELRSDLLLELYRERLNNAARFRQIFFELDDRVKQEGATTQAVFGATVAAPAAVSTVNLERQQKLAEDSTAIQGNILKMLERQLRDLEKSYNKKEEALHLAGEEILKLKDVAREKEMRVSSLEKKLVQLEDNNNTLRLALDAAQRDVAQKPGKPTATADNRPSARVMDADRTELLARIDAMEQELATTSDAAYNALMASSDLGIVILFMLSSFKRHSEEQLAQEMARSIATLGVKAVVGIVARHALVIR